MKRGVRALGPEHPVTLRAMNTLGHVLLMQGHHADAIGHFREALAIRRRVTGNDHPTTITLMCNLAYALDDIGEHAEGEHHYREALARLRKLPGQHGLTLWTANRLGVHLRSRGRLAEAEPLSFLVAA